MKTHAASDSAAGTVRFVAGEVKAVAVDGTSRALQVGDRVFVNEVVATTANAVVQIHLENGRLFELGHDSTVVLDELAVGSGTAAPAAPASQGVEELPNLSGADSKAVSAVAAGTPDALAETGNERRGGDTETVVLDQANTTVQVTSGFTAESVLMGSARAEAEPNPLREEASFLVQDAPLFRHPAVAISEARPADKGSADSVADGSGSLGESSTTLAETGSPAQGGSGSGAPPAGESLALGDLLDQQPSNDLAAYLSFTYDAHTNSTTVNVHPASGSGGDHQIVLMGVDLTSRGTLTTDTIIQNLLATSKLHTDA